MGERWDNFKQDFKKQWKTDSRSEPAPDCFFWPGVAFLVVVIVLAICKLASIYN